MHIEDVAKHFEKRARQRGLHYVLGGAAPEAVIVQAEERLRVVFPAQVKRFYQHYNGLHVEDPPLEVVPLERLAFSAPARLHFATVDREHQLCFDVSQLNEAGQWDIVSAPDGVPVTLTMASFWSNKLWAWIDQGRAIWRPEAPPRQ